MTVSYSFIENLFLATFSCYNGDEIDWSMTLTAEDSFLFVDAI
jgi:hypothetical protein